VVLLSVFMHVPSPCLFRANDFSGPTMQEVCATSILAVLGGARSVRLFRFR